MSAIDNCLEHGQPHGSYGRCTEYVSRYNLATDQWLARGGNRTGFGESRLPEDLKQCNWHDSRWPEPHEGIIGVERTVDDLLDLSDEALARRKIMCAMAHLISRALPFGGPNQQLIDIADRLREPQIGDLVVESTVLYDYPPGDRHRMGFGILLAKRTEWWDTHEVYAAHLAEERAFNAEHGYDDLPDDPRPIESAAWYVQYGSNAEAVCRWTTNCSFLALPMEHEMVRIKLSV